MTKISRQKCKYLENKELLRLNKKHLENFFQILYQKFSQQLYNAFYVRKFDWKSSLV